MQTTRKIKVLVIDDSAFMRGVLTDIINRTGDMAVVGGATDPLQARQLIRDLEPDVLTLDVEMPKMNGLEFLEWLMQLRPMPVVMVSALTERGSETALRALELGAVDVVAKPKADVAKGIHTELVERIRAAAQARVAPRSPVASPPSTRQLPALGNGRVAAEKVIAIGSSTGGTEALREFLVQLPEDAPAVVIAQHMPAGFTRTFAQRLDAACRIVVKEGENGERALPGHAYIAPGDRHLAVRRSGAHYVVALSDGPPVNRHRPSVEVLFLSVAQHVGHNAIGVMMTGMGKDGAQAMLAMKRAGAYNFAQDEASCVVFGMPREAIALGAVDEIVPLSALSGRVFDHLSARPSAHRS
jgi:two-component system, chemotaxis family, protein-glutamate methylesterase/glutaminase